MGNRWGKGKREWGAKGGEGEVSIQPTRDQSGRESHHDAKEGFQVSKRGDRGRRVGISKQRGVNKGLGVHLQHHANLYISSQLCKCCANKGLCLGYK
jgi:hypothetical protein